MEAPTLFDQAAADTARDRAIGAAANNADPYWWDAALDAVRHVAQSHQSFTTDEVWQYLNVHRKDVATHEPRALGAVMKAASTYGWVVGTQEYSRSKRPSAHSRPVLVWRSLLTVTP